MKATVKTNKTANLKPMDGSGQLGVLIAGQYVFGELSVQETDIINFNHYYTESGVKIPLSKPCKVFIGDNLIITNEVEDDSPPGPDPEVPPVVYPPVSVSFDFTDKKTLTIFSDIDFEVIIYNGNTLKNEDNG